MVSLAKCLPSPQAPLLSLWQSVAQISQHLRADVLLASGSPSVQCLELIWTSVSHLGEKALANRSAFSVVTQQGGEAFEALADARIFWGDQFLKKG